jgi:hypothetical protein
VDHVRARALDRPLVARAKSFDAFMLTVLIILIGATLESVKKYLPGKRA